MLFGEQICLYKKAEKETQKKMKLKEKAKDNSLVQKFEIEKDLDSAKINIIKDDKKEILRIYYIKNLSEQAFRQYGTYFLQSFNIKESNTIVPENFMNNHKISSFIRSKMVDWMLEIFYVFQSNEETFLASIELMDKFFYHYKKRKLINEDIHLIGITCIFIASKIYDLIPIQLHHIIHDIGNDKFSSKTILNMERRIIKTINFDIFSLNSFELIRFLIYDFYVNNKDKFKALNANKFIDMLTNTSIWIYKMCKHYEEYSSVPPIFLTVSCLLIAYDIMSDNCDDFNGKIKKFFRQWLSFLFNGIGKKDKGKENIEIIYKKIQNTFKNHRTSSFRNLIIYQELYFR